MHEVAKNFSPLVPSEKQKTTASAKSGLMATHRHGTYSAALASIDADIEALAAAGHDLSRDDFVGGPFPGRIIRANPVNVTIGKPDTVTIRPTKSTTMQPHLLSENNGVLQDNAYRITNETLGVVNEYYNQKYDIECVKTSVFSKDMSAEVSSDIGREIGTHMLESRKNSIGINFTVGDDYTKTNNLPPHAVAVAIKRDDDVIKVLVADTHMVKQDDEMVSGFRGDKGYGCDTQFWDMLRGVVETIEGDQSDKPITVIEFEGNSQKDKVGCSVLSSAFLKEVLKDDAKVLDDVFEKVANGGTVDVPPAVARTSQNYHVYQASADDVYREKTAADGTTLQRKVGEHSKLFESPIETTRSIDLSLIAGNKRQHTKAAQALGYTQPKGQRDHVYSNKSTDPGNAYVRAKTLAFMKLAVEYAKTQAAEGHDPKAAIEELRDKRSVGRR